MLLQSSDVLTRSIMKALLINPFPAGPLKIGRYRPINSNRRRRIALFPIDVKFGTMIDYEISQLLAEFQND